jgi:surface protein
MAAFKATWQLPVGGGTVTLPGVNDLAQYALDCTIDWGDGSPAETFVNYVINIDGPQLSHLYPAGTFQMSITGKYRGWNFDWLGSKSYLISIDYWGDNVLSFSTGASAFSGCINLEYLPTEGSVIFPSSCVNMFQECSKLKSGLDSVDVSNVTIMRNMFFVCNNFNGDISKWNTSKVTDMTFMFFGCAKFNRDISKWDTSKVTTMTSMFSQCTSFRQDLSLWNLFSISSNAAAPRFTSAYIAAVRPRFSSEYPNSWRFKAPVTSAVINTILPFANEYYIDGSLRLRLQTDIEEIRFSQSVILTSYNTRMELDF